MLESTSEKIMLRTSCIALSISILLACGGRSEPDDDGTLQTTDAGSGGRSSAGGAGGAGGSGGGTPAAATGNAEPPTDESASAVYDGSFDECVASLKKSCGYDEKATACASLKTPSIPLSSGGTYGDMNVMTGPYGGFVAWNQGKDFANPVSASEMTCDFIAGAFGEPPSVTQDILNLRGQDLSLYTIFRPACMKDGEKYPVITWGNGTCGQSGGYASLLAGVASYGFVIIAANSRFTNAGNKEMLKALDFAKALNEDSDSLYYQRLDLDKVGAMGHSQGSSATENAAADPRIKAVILFNGGLGSMDKPFLAVSGDRDITNYTPMQMAMGVESASQPGAWLFYHEVLETGGNVTGHLTLMEQPDRVLAPTVAWWKYQLNGDAEAKKVFVGDDCGLCNKQEQFEYGQRGLP